MRVAPSTIKRCRSWGRIVSLNASPSPCKKSKTSVSSTWISSFERSRIRIRWACRSAVKIHPSHRAHEGGIHHRAIFQVDHKFAVAAIDHFARELLQVPAVQEASFTLYLHPDGWAVHPYLNR